MEFYITPSYLQWIKGYKNPVWLDLGCDEDGESDFSIMYV